MIGFFRRTISRASRHWLTVAFFLGFITDVILLNRVDDIVDNAILLFHATLSTVALLLFYLGAAERLGDRISRFLKRYAPIVMQYAFGGLLSGMLIFYGRSGDWLVSAPFLLLIVAVILGNEFMAKRSERLLYHLSLYFIGIFSYVVLVVPVLLGQMGDWIFIFSGFLALGVVAVVVQLLGLIVPNFMRTQTHRIILVIGFFYIGFNMLYFTNTIPPIPLSLTELNIAQSVTRLTDGDYRVITEEQSLWRRLPFVREEIHPLGGSIACFARVYAPTKLETTIYHNWEWQDEGGEWQEGFRLGYEISGLNEGGYRGYTRVTRFTDGVWRCTVETERGQVLGRRTVLVDTTGPARATYSRIE